MADSDEEITESDVISEGGSDIEARFDRWLCDAEIQERVRKSVPVATRYKDGWAVKTFETWRLTRQKMAVSDKTIRCFKRLSKICRQMSVMSRFRILCLKSKSKTAENIQLIHCIVWFLVYNVI